MAQMTPRRRARTGMQSIVALAVKDLRLLLRVRSGLFFTFVWPIIVAVLFGFVFSGQSQSTSALRVVVVDEDGSEGSRTFVSTLESSGDFTVDRAGRAEAETMVRRAQRAAFVVLKPGFGAASERLFYGEPRRIEIGSDPARQAEASMIEGLLTKHAMANVQKLFDDPESSRKMVDSALKEIGAAGNQSALSPVTRFLGELNTFLATPMPRSDQGAQNWTPL